jgi:hypothetical protein
LQKLKRELHNNRIAVDDIGSFKSISKIMIDYKDKQTVLKKFDEFGETLNIFKSIPSQI